MVGRACNRKSRKIHRASSAKAYADMERHLPNLCDVNSDGPNGIGLYASNRLSKSIIDANDIDPDKNRRIELCRTTFTFNHNIWLEHWESLIAQLIKNMNEISVLDNEQCDM